MKSAGSGLWVIRSFVHSATPSPHPETWGASTCKQHTLPPALPSLSTRHLGFLRHFPMPLICLSSSSWPALVARRPLKSSQTFIIKLCKWVVQNCLKELKKKTCDVTKLPDGFCAFANGYATPGRGPTWNFYISISVVLECLFIKQETVEIKNKNNATQSNWTENDLTSKRSLMFIFPRSPFKFFSFPLILWCSSEVKNQNVAPPSEMQAHV